MSTTQLFLVGVLVVASGVYPLLLLAVVNTANLLRDVEGTTGLKLSSQQEAFRNSLLKSSQKYHYLMAILTAIACITMVFMNNYWAFRASVIPVALSAWHTYRYISIEFKGQVEGGSHAHRC